MSLLETVETISIYNETSSNRHERNLGTRSMMRLTINDATDCLRFRNKRRRAVPGRTSEVDERF